MSIKLHPLPSARHRTWGGDRTPSCSQRGQLPLLSLSRGLPTLCSWTKDSLSLQRRFFSFLPRPFDACDDLDTRTQRDIEIHLHEQAERLRFERLSYSCKLAPKRPFFDQLADSARDAAYTFTPEAGEPYQEYLTVLMQGVGEADSLILFVAGESIDFTQLFS